MIRLRRGVVRSIGVSNFTAHARPARGRDGRDACVNQVELHPYFPQAELRAYHAEHYIRTELEPARRRSELLPSPSSPSSPRAQRVARAGRARVAPRPRAVPIPKSADAAERRRQNLDVFDIELDPAEVEAISGLERGRLWGADPDVHEEDCSAGGAARWRLLAGRRPDRRRRDVAART